MTKTIKKIFITVFLAATIFIFAFAAGISFISPAYAYAENADEKVYLGGTPIGIIANSDGLVVHEFVNVTTSNKGSFSPALKSGVKKGDVLIAANGNKLQNIEQLSEIIENSTQDVLLTVKRRDDKIALTVSPEIDAVHGTRKIGLSLRDNVAGIGTVTFVKSDGEYGALGHTIADSFMNTDIYDQGTVYRCEITGYKKATADAAGELTGKINVSEHNTGTITKNRFCGIFGKITEKDYYSDNPKIEIGTKNEVTPGTAYIVTSINDNPPQRYEIDIIKANSQEKPAEKGMVIRVTDKKLLSTTGGILQGMSGSPIIQNGKLVGAVTHVFTNDTTTGYGMYIDWMLNEVQ